MMFTKEYKQVYLLVFLLFTVWSGVEATNQTLFMTTGEHYLRINVLFIKSKQYCIYQLVLVFSRDYSIV